MMATLWATRNRFGILRMSGAKTTAKKLRGRPFQKGQSANPWGRPKGARNKATLAAEALLDGECEALTRKAIRMALAGDGMAMRLCMERIVPPRRDRPVRFSVPQIKSAAEASRALAGVLRGVAAGDVTPSEAEGVANVIRTYVR